MKVEWFEKTLQVVKTCPVCLMPGGKLALVRAHSAIKPHGVSLLRCDDCTSLFYDDLTTFDYEAPTIHNGGDLPDYIQFYVDQGAGIDSMAEPLYQLQPGEIKSYLEIGCGLGFSLDYARQMFSWNVKGIDPSPISAVGREMLGLEIDEVYLSEDTEPQVKYDLVLASEVIEHVPDPLAFLNIIKSTLGPKSTLLLTTPNAKAVRIGGRMVFQILAPGQHLVLFTKQSLELLLKKAGFEQVSVTEFEFSLHAAASNYPLNTRSEYQIDRDAYLRYLEQRVETLSANSPLELGYRYRIFKELVNQGKYLNAKSVLQAASRSLMERYQLDLGLPDDILATIQAIPLNEFSRHLPYNIGGWLYFSGMIALNEDARPEMAAKLFEAGGAASLLTRLTLNSYGADDGETEELCFLARLHQVVALARFDRNQAIRVLEAINLSPLPVPGSNALWQLDAAKIDVIKQRIEVEEAAPKSVAPPSAFTNVLRALGLRK